MMSLCNCNVNLLLFRSLEVDHERMLTQFEVTAQHRSFHLCFAQLKALKRRLKSISRSCHTGLRYGPDSHRR
jgi:hypothetical protein